MRIILGTKMRSEADKEGYISKDVLVEIIKEEFELTIDMVVSKTHNDTVTHR